MRQYGHNMPGVNKVPCPGCGTPFEPIFHGEQKLYCSSNCGAMIRMRAMRKRRKEERLAAAKQNQRALKFQPAAKSDRRKKGHVRPEPKPVEESMFA